MTVDEQITQIYNNAQNMKSALINKGQTVTDVISTYPGAISNIPVSSDIGITREISSNGVYQVPTNSFTFTLPTTATNVGDYTFYYAFFNCTGITSADLSSLTTVSGNYAFYYAFRSCSSLTSADLSSLTTVSGNYAFYYAFRSCSSLTSVNFSKLTTINGTSGLAEIFRSCTGLTSVDFSKLTTVSGSSALYYAFYTCTKLANVYFRALTTTSFGSYTDQFSYMLSGTGSSVTHTLHFPSNMESTISTLSGYPTFGGTSGYVTLAYDLPATS